MLSQKGLTNSGYMLSLRIRLFARYLLPIHQSCLKKPKELTPFLGWICLIWLSKALWIVVLFWWLCDWWVG